MAASTEAAFNHHLPAFAEKNLAAILEDYTKESLLFTPAGVLRGPKEMAPLFESFFAEFSKPGATFTMDQQMIRGEIAYIVWHAETAENHYEFATVTFVVRDGKVAVQTFAAKITPKR